MSLAKDLASALRRTVKQHLLTRCLLFPTVSRAAQELDDDCVRLVIRARETLKRPRAVFINGVAWQYESCAESDRHSLELTGICQRYWTGENIVALDRATGAQEVELLIPPADAGEGEVAPRVSDPVLRAVLGFLAAARIRDPRSPYQGLWHGAWDEEAAAWRLPHWTWPSGVIIGAIDAVLRGPRRHLNPGVREQLEGWRAEAGVALRRLQEGCLEQPGAFPVRWDYSVARRSGVVEWVSPNDVALCASYAFGLSGRGWRPEEAAAFEEVWNWVRAEGFDGNGHVRCGYILREERWDRSWLYVDAGFIFRIYWAAQRMGLLKESDVEDCVARARRYCERFFVPEQGYLIKNWRRWLPCDRSLFSRGQGWALEGLLAVLEVKYDEELGSICRSVCDRMLVLQTESGAWYYVGDDPDSGIDAKGVPVIALQLIRASRLLGDSRYAAAARRALRWCDELWASEGDRFGSTWSREGCVTVGLRNRSCSFPYGAAFYLLARMAAEDEGEV